MSKNPENLSIRICHLYAHFLNIYGDRGNILTLVKRSQWRGINAEVTAVGLDDKLDIGTDIYFIGGGQDKQQQVIAEDLQRHKKALKEATDAGAVILSICGGYQLLGHYYRPHEGPELPGLSLIDAYTVAGHKRMIGNVVVNREDGSTLVGFENHSGRTFLGAETKALGKVTTGNGNNGEDGFEGVAEKTIFGTYLHGSLLPKNPHFADHLIALALKRRYGDIALPELDDSLELTAHHRALSLPA
ncbi:MAG: hypothetical protein K2Y22_08520 [Candidatus Obscuribacterales bacterium]|nr:hypothetical protein [Candidatus Obscuribacterales bacterium]